MNLKFIFLIIQMTLNLHHLTDKLKLVEKNLKNEKNSKENMNKFFRKLWL